jgi:ribonuclease VapC
LADRSVFDSSAVLAVIFSEPGSEPIIDLLQGGLLSTVNLAEIHTRLLLDGRAPEVAWARLRNMGLDVCSFTDSQARVAGELIEKTKRFCLSLGDRACLALAIEREATVYTADRAWKSIELGIPVEVIR